MELKLNIYNKKQIEKTYVTETYDIMFGTIEDLLNVIDLDKYNIQNDLDMVKFAMNLIPKSLNTIKPLLKDIFDGLTDDELKRTKVTEIAHVLIGAIKFAITQIQSGSTGKN